MPSNTQKFIMGNDLAVYVSEGLLGRGATLRSFHTTLIDKESDG